MALTSISPGLEITDPVADYRTSQRIEQYRFSGQAAYFPAWPSAKYLPLAAVRQAWIQDSLLPLTGTCGKALPITILRVRYKGNYYQTFTFEKKHNAQKALEILRANCPEAVFEPEPVGPLRDEFLSSLPQE